MANAVTRSAPPAGEKPRFLGLLNEISEAERRGFTYLTAWADRCSDPDLEEVLRLVAAREAEHSASFARRVVELGFRVRVRPDTEAEAERLELVRSESDDRAVFEALGYAEEHSSGGPDIFDGYFADHSIDPATGALLGRFIAEERDSGRMLRGAYERLVSGREAAV